MPVDAIRSRRRGFRPCQTQLRLARSWPNKVVGWKKRVILVSVWGRPVDKYVQNRSVPTRLKVNAKVKFVSQGIDHCPPSEKLSVRSRADDQMDILGSTRRAPSITENNLST